MELKQSRSNSGASTSAGFYSYLYGIETSKRNITRFYHIVLLVPLWNWNNTNSISVRSSWMCFTRTFMELKLGSVQQQRAAIAVLLVPLWNWNITEPTPDNNPEPVLLVPLWNWNKSAYGLEKLRGKGFTRTFMELKPCVWYSSVSDIPVSFTRTFMELKQLWITR